MQHNVKTVWEDDSNNDHNGVLSDFVGLNRSLGNLMDVNENMRSPVRLPGDGRIEIRTSDIGGLTHEQACMERNSAKLKERVEERDR
jgi:hypothetical protein